MDESYETALGERAAVCRMLSAAFLELPDLAQVEAMLSAEYDDAEGSGGYAELARYARECAGRDPADVLLDVSRDRVLMVRGMGDDAIVPPYESQYLGFEPNASIGGLNRFYAEAGLSLTGEAKDAPDQVGVELACLARLLERELAALREGDEEAAAVERELHERFCRQHIGRWAGRYADEVIGAAGTGYWRAIGMMLKEVLE